MAAHTIHGLSLCSGIGGLDLAMRLVHGDAYRCVGHVEREAYAAAVLVARMEEQALDPAPIWDDLTTFPSGLYRGRVDHVSAGFPCQPFSVAGKQRGTEDDRWLWPHVWATTLAVGARELFIENVPGLEEPVTDMGGSKIGRSKMEPFRRPPCFGKVIEDPGEPFSSPPGPRRHRWILDRAGRRRTRRQRPGARERP